MAKLKRALLLDREFRRDLWTLALTIGLLFVVAGLSSTVNKIQTSRLENCRDVTERNLNTVAIVNQLVAKQMKGKTRRQQEQLEAQAEQTIGIINAILPPRSEKQCEALIGEDPPAPPLPTITGLLTGP